MGDERLARWTDVERVLDEVLDLEVPPDERRSRARAACGDDVELAQAVEAMLGADAATLDSGSASALLTAALADPAPTDLPEAVGPFRVLAQLGSGGMGRVFVAQRDEPGVHPRVALKIVHRVVDTSEARRRFARERETLARLDHPHIARLHDGGITADGMPYLAVELVDGQPIDEHCERHHLDLGDRLRLVCQVCHAVAFAHSRLVVHRDLKPANVMVDTHGQVKLLDFGIAKWLDELDAESPLTTVVHRVLTPAHASPEQFGGEPITAATDVYQLGLLLYRLLTGQRAFHLEAPTPEAIRHLVCDVEPPRPSTLDARLRGDLDAIVLKALRKSPADRYAAVDDLRRDLEAYLDHRPVAARQGTWLYAARKYVRRHRAPLAATATLVLASAAGVAGVAVQARIAAAERDRAVAAEGTATAVNAFLVDELLAAATPDRSQETTPTVADVLVNASRSVGFALTGAPAVEAQMRQTLARSFLALGQHDEAKAQARAAQRLMAARHGADDPPMLQARRLLAEIAIAAGDYAGLVDESLAVLHGYRRSAGTAHPETLLAQATYGRALTLTNAFEQAKSTLRDADTLAREASVPFDTRTTVRAALLDALLAQATNGREAEPLAREHLEALRQRFGPRHPRLVPAGTFLVRSLTEQLKYEEAVAAAEEQVRLHEALYGVWHLATANAVNQLSIAYDRASHDQQSSEAGQRALDIFRRTVGPEHPKTIAALRNVAIDHRRHGRPAEALAMYREIVANNRRTLGELHPTTIAHVAEQINSLMDLKRVAEARGVATEVVSLYARAIASSHTVEPAMLVAYGQFLLRVEPADLRAPHRAIPLFERAVELTHRRDLASLRGLAFALDDAGSGPRALATATEVMALPEGIESWTTEQLVVKTLRTLDPDRVEPWLLERLETLRRVRGPDEYLQIRTLGHLADWAREHGRTNEAEQRMRQQLDVLARSAPPDHFYVATVKSNLGALLMERGTLAEAETLLRESFAGHLASRRFSQARREEARDRLARLYDVTNRPAEARRIRGVPLPTVSPR